MKAAVLFLVFMVVGSVQAQETIPVELRVQSADAVTATQVRRRLADALDEIGDVERVDAQGQFRITIVAVKLELSSRAKVGYALSTVVTTRFPPDNVASLVDPDLQEYAAMLMEDAREVKQHWIEIVRGENFDESMKEIAKQLDMRVLQPYRDDAKA